MADHPPRKTPSAPPLVGRLAPSPTGAQHIGNARTFLLAWLSIRSRGGTLLLRMEDIDSPRVKSWGAEQALEDLEWLGLDWDEGPDRGGPRGPYVQSLRLDRYREALAALQRSEQVYPCTCSRSDVASAASAPHRGAEGIIYPGTCAGRSVAAARALETAGRRFAWRFRMPRRNEPLHDRFAGTRTCDWRGDLGDFVVFKSDGTPAYQLAVVVDDAAMGVTEVVRGDDLLPSTFRQLALYRFFDWSPPAFYHVPLVVGRDGRRLAKRHGDTRLASLRRAGVSATDLVGYLAHSCGLLPEPRPVRAEDLIDRFDFDRVTRTPWTWDDRSMATWMRDRAS